MAIENYYKITVQGCGFKQADMVKQGILGFYTTFGLLAKDIEEIKKQLPEKFNDRCVKHSVSAARPGINQNRLIIEGMYSANQEDTAIDGFSFYKANLLNRLGFNLRLCYLSIFDPVRVLRFEL